MEYTYPSISLLFSRALQLSRVSRYINARVPAGKQLYSQDLDSENRNTDVWCLWSGSSPHGCSGPSDIPSLGVWRPNATLTTATISCVSAVHLSLFVPHPQGEIMGVWFCNFYLYGAPVSTLMLGISLPGPELNCSALWIHHTGFSFGAFPHFLFLPKTLPL